MLYPGEAPGPQILRLSRLVPGRTYAVIGDSPTTALTAEAQGTASVTVVLDGRTPVRLVPDA
ncbi:hypothetical protein [Streptomyces capitiformicae]|uniref:Uncharacterized protein n=1 Tax=Streptomyces capitiformicae TaxID=2014920 RepID=A0A918ZA18_9ACTN|nr:hypothetical protein [Streptomyces capitiformicae]GHE41653.1 hypothetical protein GCM10017771_60990 [Streptomyces capitiformicae]